MYEGIHGLSPGVHVHPFWGLVDASLAAGPKAKVLDRVGHVDRRAVDTRLLEALVEQPTGRTDERMAIDVLTITRLLADEHQTRVGPTLTEHRLGGPVPELARPAVLDGVAQVIEPVGVRDRRRWLELYAERFDTVEVNNTFYRLPKVDAVSSWVKQTPPGFLFAVKASRYLTHIRRDGTRSNSAIPAGSPHRCCAPSGSTTWP